MRTAFKTHHVVTQVRPTMENTRMRPIVMHIMWFLPDSIHNNKVHHLI